MWRNAHDWRFGPLWVPLFLCQTRKRTTDKLRLSVMSICDNDKYMEPEKHAGELVRTELQKRKLSVTSAAKQLGVSRQALSNLVNAKSSLSPEMATRLKKTFGIECSGFLDRQTRREAEAHSGEVSTTPFVPALSAIKAREIVDWAHDDITARRTLPVLLRKLAYSTGRQFTKLCFHGYDNAERKGWDGEVVSEASSPWVPKGISGWEFGCNRQPKVKAEKDYKARTKSVPKKERKDTVFIFVTPQNWPGKDSWAKEKRAKKTWKDVRVYDASDLEQWIEKSATVQVWFAELLSRPIAGYRSLEQCWGTWSRATSPPLPRELFAPAVRDHLKTIEEWLKQEPQKPLCISADSTEEAVAFLSVAFEQSELAEFGDRVLKVDDVDALRRLRPASPGALVLLATDSQVRKEMAAFLKDFHCMVFLPRNLADQEADIKLEPLRPTEFSKALEAIGLSDDVCSQLARKSACSPTILRRQIAISPVLVTPSWASNPGLARKLIPLSLVGAWHAASQGDREVLKLVADVEDYRALENALSELAAMEDAPVWSTGRYRGVYSKSDCLFAIASQVTEADLDNFFMAAEYVLSESDPALSLPPEKRSFAGLYGKLRSHSSAIRRSLCETLTILSLHGNHLFWERTGVDVERSVRKVIRNLLTPFTSKNLQSHNRDLPHYAEAAPELFLSLLEADLIGGASETLDLLAPSSTGLLGGGCSRAGLLWALECLAWMPHYFGRVAEILAILARVEIKDNWGNRPDRTLESLFRSWMPQTAADMDRRKTVLSRLMQKHGNVAWRLCLSQLSYGHRVGAYNYRPRWRTDSQGAGHPLTVGEDFDFRNHVFELMLRNPQHSEETLGDLVEVQSALSKEQCELLVRKVESWLRTSPKDEAVATLRQRLRKPVTVNSSLSDALLQKLEPKDLVLRFLPLFDSEEFFIHACVDDDVDYAELRKRLSRERASALGGIWNELGFDGLFRLIEKCRDPALVAVCLRDLFNEQGKVRFVLGCLEEGRVNKKAVHYCLNVFLQTCTAEEVSAIDAEVWPTLLGDDKKLEFLVSLPFSLESWMVVASKGEKYKGAYWSSVVPSWKQYTVEEVNEIVDRFLRVDRPKAAAHAVRMEWSRLETSRLLQLLHALPQSDEPDSRNYRLNGYDIGHIFEELDTRPNVSTEEKADLEIVYLDVLTNEKYGIPNLEKVIARKPDLYAELICLLYRRKDEEPTAEEHEQNGHLIGSAYRILTNLRGVLEIIQQNGDLPAWVAMVRAECRSKGRLGPCDEHLGQLFASQQEDEEGFWPPRSICALLEEIHSDKIANGILMGVINSRGAVFRGEGGNQEREIESKYRAYAEHVSPEFPYVGRKVEMIANYYAHEAKCEDLDSKVERRLDFYN